METTNEDLFTLTNIYTFNDVHSESHETSQRIKTVESFSIDRQGISLKANTLYITFRSFERINHYLSLEHLASSSPTLSTSNSLPSAFTDAQRTLRKWLEDTEQSLLNDQVRFADLPSINSKKKIYKDLLDQTLDYEHLMEFLNGTVRDYQVKLTVESHRRLQEELTNYKDRLYDVKMFLTERLTKYNRIDQTLTKFQVCSSLK